MPGPILSTHVSKRAIKRLLEEDAYRADTKEAIRNLEGLDVLQRCKQLNAFLKKEFHGGDNAEGGSDTDSDIHPAVSRTDSDISDHENKGPVLPKRVPAPSRQAPPCPPATPSPREQGRPPGRRTRVSAAKRPEWQRCMKAPNKSSEASRIKPALVNRRGAEVQEKQLRSPPATEAVHAAARRIQCCYRRFRTVRALRANAVHAAACCIQRCYRRCRTVRALRSTLAARKSAACMIQRHWRSWVSNRRMRAYKQQRQDAAAVIQRHVRGWHARQRARATLEPPETLRRGRLETPQCVHVHRCRTDRDTAQDGLGRHPRVAAHNGRREGKGDVRPRTAPEDAAVGQATGSFIGQDGSTYEAPGSTYEAPGEGPWSAGEPWTRVSDTRAEACQKGHCGVMSRHLTNSEEEFKSCLCLGGSSRGHRRRRAAVVIQKYWRGWCVRQRLGFNPPCQCGRATARFISPRSPLAVAWQHRSSCRPGTAPSGQLLATLSRAHHGGLRSVRSDWGRGSRPATAAGSHSRRGTANEAYPAMSFACVPADEQAEETQRLELLERERRAAWLYSLVMARPLSATAGARGPPRMRMRNGGCGLGIPSLRRSTDWEGRLHQSQQEFW